jgi:hypothetical protein
MPKFKIVVMANLNLYKFNRVGFNKLILKIYILNTHRLAVSCPHKGGWGLRPAVKI